MDNKLINQKRAIGDWSLVAEITGKTREACREAWKRKTGNAYTEVREVLIKVIENRESFLKQFTESNS